MSDKVHQLEDQQALAVNPQDSVWLSASAGTGKTQVLSARVLRLLLRPDVRPEQVLCLTFTKAGAAEMATRVNEVLASWVRLDKTRLGKQLANIGAPVDPDTVARARTLFASVLDCPGGGLRIDTIHAFAQWLLAAFPEEAELAPGTRPMEDRDRELLSQQVLRDVLEEAERGNDRALIQALEDLSVRLGPDGTRKYLMRCAEAREAWLGTGSWQPPMEARTKQLLGLPSDAGPQTLAALVADGAYDRGALEQCLAANRAWGTVTAQKSADAIEAWLASEGEARVAACEALQSTLFTQKGEVRSLSSLEKQDPAYAEAARRVGELLKAVAAHKAMLDLAAWLAPALEAGRKFALDWEAAKQREGFIDFDDQIRQAASLLSKAALSDWIRYKLDRRFDHLLIDEAQDTNAAQWQIIRALTDDFFSGKGQREGRQRTIFVVGDYKQAIFGFQGTSPENFRREKERFAAIMREAKANADLLREGIDARELVELGLGRSYRTSQPVLDFVDAAIAAIGPAQFGLDHTPEHHKGFDRPGLVRLWQPVKAIETNDDDDPEGPDWVSEPERHMADRIADQVRAWLHEGYPLVGKKRNATAGDIMVLVRKRRELAGLIVARLQAAGVPVAGVDRLRLGAPLAVRDLMAALRFAAQPLDSLTLASLLVSPLIGWKQEQLLEHGHRDPKTALWDHLRRSDAPFVVQTVEKLGDLLGLADFEPPQALLHWLLVGPWQGRRKLVLRLGREANDPIDELLNAALAFSSAHTPSLQGFIRWFDAGEGELKRESDGSGGLVRVMTVHGSKGLQAPIVILADATGNPDSSPARAIALSDPMDEKREMPIPPLRGSDQVGRISARMAELAAAEREEHWRLLYVAMTRAEEALFIGGALGKRETAPAPDSWYARLAPLVESEELEDPIWGMRRDWGAMPPPIVGQQSTTFAPRIDIPDWAKRSVGEEPRPPRPLAPSGLGEEQGTDPPLLVEQAKLAARRGVLIHALLERLPDVVPEARAGAAHAWLARQAADLPEDAREDMLASALSVLAEPGFAHVFAPGSLAEVPLAAEVDGQVIAGTIDRLLVTSERVTVVDYKTARRPPASLEQVPEKILRQMGAYAAALARIYPGRTIDAALLYTHAPLLIPIDPELLERFKPTYPPLEESFAASAVE